MPVGLTAMGSKIELEGTKMLTSRGLSASVSADCANSEIDRVED
jgi:hypothetical protein